MKTGRSTEKLSLPFETEIHWKQCKTQETPKADDWLPLRNKAIPHRLYANQTRPWFHQSTSYSQPEAPGLHIPREQARQPFPSSTRTSPRKKPRLRTTPSSRIPRSVQAPPAPPWPLLYSSGFPCLTCDDEFGAGTRNR